MNFLANLFNRNNSQPQNNNNRAFFGVFGGGMPTTNAHEHRQQPSPPSTATQVTWHHQPDSQRGNQNIHNPASHGSVTSYYQQQISKQSTVVNLLIHARSCSACTNKLCAGMKELLEHIRVCKENSCSHRGCGHMKGLVTHLRQCQLPLCATCLPVRRHYLGLINAQPRLSNNCVRSNSVSEGLGPRMVGSKTSRSMVATSDDLQTSSKRSKTEEVSISGVSNIENNSLSLPVMNFPCISQHAPSHTIQTVVRSFGNNKMVGMEIEHPLRTGPITVNNSQGSKNKYEDNGNIERGVELILREEQTRPAKEVSALGLSNTESNPPSLPAMNLPSIFQHATHASQTVVHNYGDKEMVEMNIEQPLRTEPRILDNCQSSKNKTADNNGYIEMGVELILREEKPRPKEETEKISHFMTDSKEETTNLIVEQKIKSASLIDHFTVEQIIEHTRGLQEWNVQSKAKQEENQEMSENFCQLCKGGKLEFKLPPMQCTRCGHRIHWKANFYATVTGGVYHCVCNNCYKAQGDTLQIDGAAIPKANMEKKRKNEGTDEEWVQCDKCNAWEHQICALYNRQVDSTGTVIYTCSYCCIEDIEKGERKPLPKSSILGAKDLPRTILSDHLEQRLYKRLKEDRNERATRNGQNFEDVQGAEALVVRVVLSVDKKVEVNKHFLEILQENNYPDEFPYRSKMIMLFQKIDGVDICLFGMYVQEFGSDCQAPNHRRVYISYLDSVKYFQPEIQAASGDPLRTFVYHEILIGYLEYCKIRGFISCYIWASPPQKGDDYILYCHPEIQKTPKSDMLKKWYQSMLKKAIKENIVVSVTNIYDQFFVATKECKAKVTATRLPYFDGDYWPQALEAVITELCQEENRNSKETLANTAPKDAPPSNLSSNSSKDILIMQKLRDKVFVTNKVKDDFIMVHLQHACNHCGHFMVSGNRWVCKECTNFQLCDNCHGEEEKTDAIERHPIDSTIKHAFSPVDVSGVPVDTKDKDEIIESKLFDIRSAFLSLCKRNHYQYDSLRRAKHSSMMVLYHLHDSSKCNGCHNELATGQEWQFETCSGYRLCDACFQKEGIGVHHQNLPNYPSVDNCDNQTTNSQQQIVSGMLEVLVHASRCCSGICSYKNCRRNKNLFQHGFRCKTRANGGCPSCINMWIILQLHARACDESDCQVPRCKDLKEHMRRRGLLSATTQPKLSSSP